jgi:type IV pilus assembly protein PilC
LIKGGIPIAQAIETSGHTVGSLLYRDALHGVAEKIRGGELLSRALEAEEKYFPPLVSQMVAVGESTGRLDDMLARVAQFYTREVDGMVSNLVELIQPALMVVIGAGVGLLFASILLPIYNLVQVF